MDMHVERIRLRGMPEEKPPVRRQKRRWEDNIKMDLRVIAGGGMD
jgi:hypothetical protein